MSNYESFRDINNLETNDLIYTVINAKYMNAIGKLSSARYNFHGIASEDEINFGLDGYCKEQVDIFHKLTNEQIAKLIQIDANYVLPYVAQFDESDNCIFSDIELAQSQEKCKSLFTYIYGNENLQKFSNSIDYIYNMQKDRNELMKKDFELPRFTREEQEEHLKQGKVPLEELKILFNQKIIYSNNPEIIEKYLKEKSLGNDTNVLFKQIIENTYGKQASKILESRPKLDVHAINSLEIFDEKILGQFGEPFVNDCITYNLRNFSTFLEAIKNHEKSKDFKTYYDALVKMQGANVETMQKSFSEFGNVTGLIKNIKNIELTENEQISLMSVFVSGNHYNIQTSNELQNYNQILNEKLKTNISEILGSSDDEFEKRDLIKDELCLNLFGFTCAYDRFKPCTAELLEKLYDFSEEEVEKSFYTDEEQKVLRTIRSINETRTLEEAKKLSLEIIQENNIRNPNILYSAIQKTSKEQTKELNKSFTTLSKLQEISDKEASNELPSVYCEQTKDVNVYHLNGTPYMFLKHVIDVGSNANIEDFFNYEGQAANASVCCRLIKSDTRLMRSGGTGLLYDNIGENMLVAAYNNDANTLHTPKRTISRGRINNKLKEIPHKITFYGNEISMYRYNRNHDRTSFRNKPVAISISSGEFSDIKKKKEIIETAEKYGLSIVVFHEQRYRANELQEKQQRQGLSSTEQAELREYLEDEKRYYDTVKPEIAYENAYEKITGLKSSELNGEQIKILKQKLAQMGINRNVKIQPPLQPNETVSEFVKRVQQANELDQQQSRQCSSVFSINDVTKNALVSGVRTSTIEKIDRKMIEHEQEIDNTERI